MKPRHWRRKAPAKSQSSNPRSHVASGIFVHYRVTSDQSDLVRLVLVRVPLRRICPIAKTLRRPTIAHQMQIRTAKMTDAATIADFNSRMAWETENRRLKPGTVRAGVRNLLKDPSKGLYFVAEIAGKRKRSVVGQL